MNLSSKIGASHHLWMSLSYCFPLTASKSPVVELCNLLCLFLSHTHKRCSASQIRWEWDNFLFASFPSSKISSSIRRSSCAPRLGKSFSLTGTSPAWSATVIIALYKLENIKKHIYDMEFQFTSYCFPTGFSISMVEDESVQQLYITDVKAGGLAFAKGLLHLFSS